ncbi:MAG: VOC family protein [Candidatus Aenigmarchaeota archaeon]|nr:VOC family protein [Candidatus Aenigmarchaeota archaeon]
MLLASGFHHIVITVSDAKRSGEFYLRLLKPLGWKVFAEEKGAFAMTDGVATFWLSEPRDYSIRGDKFDRNRIGLDHFAFSVDSMGKLKKIETILKKNRIKMSKGGITDDGFGGTGIFLKDPDGMKAEFHLLGGWYK